MRKLHSCDIGTLDSRIKRGLSSENLVYLLFLRSTDMSFSSVVRRGIIVVVLVLLNASLHRANRLDASRVVQVAAKKPEPKKTRPSSTSATDVLCEGPSVPILPPSFILPRSLWSVRAMMFLQILPDGTVNGTLKLHKYGKCSYIFIELFFCNFCSHLT